MRRLVDECNAVGWTVTTSQIENLEGVQRRGRNERRRVSVDELLALAYVLKVRPIDIVVPGDAPDDEPYKIAPEVTITAATARSWLAGGFLNDAEWVAEMSESMKWMPPEEAHNLMMQALAEASEPLKPEEREKGKETSG